MCSLKREEELGDNAFVHPLSTRLLRTRALGRVLGRLNKTGVSPALVKGAVC